MARIIPDAQSERLNFESAMSQLEQIVRKLEANTLGLDAALEEYGKAVEHIRYCQKQLSGARRKIEKLRSITSQGQAITESWEDADDPNQSNE
jgi:exodeoxyribonuclease VII small subunit